MQNVLLRYALKYPRICFQGTKYEIYHEHFAYCTCIRILYCDAGPG